MHNYFAYLSAIYDLQAFNVKPNNERNVNAPCIMSLSSFEKIPLRVFSESSEAVHYVVQQVADLIRQNNLKQKHTVLGLATGSSPIRVYDELVRLHREGGLSFEHVITFNLDEYFPMQPDELQSYVHFMHEYLFKHVNIKPENIHIPDGTLARHQIADYCQRYEQKIAEVGGIDLQLLGIGENGHIGFNEPGSTKDSKTRLVHLSHFTRLAAAGAFFGEDHVPRQAISMGVSSILQAKRIILLAWGDDKAPVIAKSVEGKQTEEIPASFLQSHPKVEMLLDEAAAAHLTRSARPWLVQAVDWDEKMTRKAVVHLCESLGKPILKLTDVDYLDHGLADLLNEEGNAYTINIRVFNQIQHTITGWPGGKPHADDQTRPERKSPYPKRVLIFSPHPDDDIISMGGTFIRLVDQGHEVHVGYQTSGNVGVFDDDVIRFADFLTDYQKMVQPNEKASPTTSNNVLYRVLESLRQKRPGQLDSEEVLQLKALIRRGEAKATCRFVGLPEEHVHFLDLPFYETGLIRKNPLGEEDIERTKALIKQIKPHQIFAAGDLSDPHGTHRVCLAAIMEACKQLKEEEPEIMSQCYVWFYRGAWAEFSIEEIDMAVPLSPTELVRKRRGIFKHESQKDRPMYPGIDQREFWQRAEDRTKGTAARYNRLGLAEYEAIECFKRWYF